MNNSQKEYKPKTNRAYQAYAKEKLAELDRKSITIDEYRKLIVLAKDKYL